MGKELTKSPEVVEQEEMLKDTGALQLPADVDKVYSVKPGLVRVFVDTVGGGNVDLNKISLAKAEKLAARGLLIKKP